MRHFINLEGWSAPEVTSMLHLASQLKEQLKQGTTHQHQLQGKNVGMLFDKSSLRTRVSFEVGLNQLGASAIVLGDSAGRLGEREPIADFARVLSRYVDAIIVRTFEESRVEELVRFGSVPVINALTDESHPCQAMADMLTLKEAWGELKGHTLVYVGDSNNVARSLMRASEKLGVHMRVASPIGYEFSPAEKAWGQERGFEFLTDPRAAAEGADALYTDVWTSMGQEKEKAKRLKDFQGFCIDEKLLSIANPKAVVLHCLPAHRGEEVSDCVIEGAQSRVFDQAENRLHAQKAVMVQLMAKT